MFFSSLTLNSLDLLSNTIFKLSATTFCHSRVEDLLKRFSSQIIIVQAIS
ncbi:MAG: hypothetical protein IPJ60_01175 [Sphingobacteriaceae bacterium]|nr:hypothetical protein [Sphingobacteriaceae bacterium]